MFEKILTPTALWKNFELPEIVGANIIEEQNSENIIISKLYIEGRKVKDGSVSIYAELMRGSKETNCPAILLVEDFEINRESKLLKDLISKGYAVLLIDLAGYKEQKQNYTVYPQSISYAVYDNSKDNLYSIKKDAKNTCWYEWCAVLKYAVKYLKSLPNITKVGALGACKVSTALWQVIGSDQNLDAAVLALNFGWIGYKGIYKFGGMIEPQFTSEACQFIAGIDSQSYAMHIKTPTLLLCATNDNNFDVDRAQDTISKIPEGIYRAMYLSANYVDKVDNVSYDNLLLFFDKFLRDEDITLPKEAEIKCDVDNGKIVVEVQTDAESALGVDKVHVFIAEEMVNPALRCYQKIDAKKGQNGKYTAKYVPYKESEILFIFAIVEYKNRLRLSTSLISKRFSLDQIDNTFKSNILYSSRIKNSQSIFAPSTSNMQDKNKDLINSAVVKEMKGPMGINGLTCSDGLLTFAPASKKYQPKNGSMLMLDVYAKLQSTLTVKLISDYFGTKTEYFVKVSLLGGDVWHNVMLEMNKFKTAEGMVLKDYSKINALEIKASGSDYLINNVLWI